MKKIIVATIIAFIVILGGCSTNIENESVPNLKPIETPDNSIVFTHDLIGKELEETIDILNESDIKYDVMEGYNETFEAGYIVSQSIAPQSKIETDDIVIITVSKGSEFVSIPDVVAMTKEESISVIEDKLLIYEVVEMHNDSVNENFVISQNPAPNTKVKIGNTITVHISLGRKKVQMEDLLNHTEAYVKSFFNGVHLEYSVSYEKSNTVDAGKVISQSVAKSNYANEGDLISIVISDGLVEFEIEDYTGRSINEVNAILDGKCNTKTNYDYSQGYEDGAIISQNITAGNLVNIESNIVFIVNNMDTKPVSFADNNLELLVRAKIKKPEGTLYYRDVKDMLNLSNYDISHDKIKNLQGIENLKSLKNLYLFGEDIVDVTPLAGLTELNNLNLECNDIQDISSLKNLVKLESIALSSNPISDISILENMKNLESAWLSGCPINSISAIKDFTSFENLNINHTYVDPQEVREIVSKFTRLRAVQFSDIKVGDLDFITSFETLKYLDAQDCDLESIEGLEKFTYLKSLKLYHNRIKDISPIKDLVHLESLWIGFNDIQDISSLGNLTKLDYLFISHIKAIDFSVIENLVNLENLYISSNTIENVEFLKDHEYLEYIEIVSDIQDKTNYDSIINKHKDRGCTVREKT